MKTKNKTEDDDVLAKYNAFKKTRRLTAAQLENDQKGLKEIVAIPSKFRFVQNDRIRAEVSYKNHIGRQESILANFEKESKEMHANLDVALNPRKEKEDKDRCKLMNELMDTRERLIKEINENKRHLFDLKKMSFIGYNHVTSNELELRDIMENPDSQNKLRRKIQTMEDRLYNCNVSLGLRIQMNEMCREDIERLLNNKKWFNTIFNELLRKLGQGKELMVQLVNDATIAYESREYSHKKVEALHARCEKETNEYNTRLTDEERRLRFFRLLCDFMNMKMSERTKVENAQNILINKDRLEMYEMKNLLESMMHVLNSLRILCDIESIAEICRVAAERTSNRRGICCVFMVVANAVVEIDAETKLLFSERNWLIDAVKTEKETRAKILEDTTKKINQKQKEKEDLKVAVEKKNEKIQHIIAYLEEFFIVTGCSKDAASKSLGKTSEINDVNILEYVNLLGLHVGDLVKLNEYEKLIYILEEEGVRKFHEAVRNFDAKKTYDTITRKLREERRFNKKMIRDYEDQEREYMSWLVKERKKRIKNRESVRKTKRRNQYAAGEECVAECTCYFDQEEDDDEDDESTDEEEDNKGNDDEEDYDHHLTYDQMELAKQFAEDEMRISEKLTVATDSEISFMYNKLTSGEKFLVSPSTRANRERGLSRMQKKEIKEEATRYPLPLTREQIIKRIVQAPLKIQILPRVNSFEQV